MPSSARRFLVLAPVIALLMAWFPMSALAATCPGDFRQLCQAAVTPGSGTTSTTFTFSVVYQDSRNRSNFSVVVRIDGVNHAMSPSGTVDLVDGTSFVYKTRLADGTHQYRFRAGLDDGSRPSIRTDTVTLTRRSGPGPHPEAHPEAHAEADPEADAEADPGPAGHAASDPEADTEGHAEADPEADAQYPATPRPTRAPTSTPKPSAKASPKASAKPRATTAASARSSRPPSSAPSASPTPVGALIVPAGVARPGGGGSARVSADRIGRAERRWLDHRPHRPAADRVRRRVPVPVGPSATTRSTRVGGRDGRWCGDGGSARDGCSAGRRSRPTSTRARPTCRAGA